MQGGQGDSFGDEPRHVAVGSQEHVYFGSMPDGSRALVSRLV